MDKLTQHLKPIWKRLTKNRIFMDREDAFNVFVSDIRRVIELTKER